MVQVMEKHKKVLGGGFPLVLKCAGTGLCGACHVGTALASLPSSGRGTGSGD